MAELLASLMDLGAALIQVAAALLALIAPLLPIIVWTAFWYLAVDWVRLRAVLGSGGWIVPVLISAFAIVIRVTASDVPATTMPFGPATLSPIVATIAWGSLLAILALMAGAAQVSRRANR